MENTISQQEDFEQAGFSGFDEAGERFFERFINDYQYYYPSGLVPKDRCISFNDWNRIIVENPRSVSIRCEGKDGLSYCLTISDIHPDNLDDAISTLQKMLGPNNDVFIITKPHWKCIKKICKEFSEYSDQIVFRFQIGSSDNKVLKFWEPNAPLFNERLRSLEFAHEKGFRTGVCCDPMLDNNVHKVIKAVKPHVTDSIWLGKMNLARASRHCRKNGHSPLEKITVIKQFEEWQSAENLSQLYKRYKDHPKILWERSVRELVEDSLDEQ